MNRQIPKTTARLAGALALVASVAAYGGGSALAQSYAASAKAFTVDTSNPILQWTYRAWCEPGNAAGIPSGPVPVDAVQLMDNAWYFGSGNNTLIVRTPTGNLLVFDALATAADMQQQVINPMISAGLDPARITHIFVGNEGAAGYEGVNLILQSYAPSAKVVATKPAAVAFMLKAGRGPSIPRRIDIIVAPAPFQDQGSKQITVETGVVVAAMVTPGATLGQMSAIVPVQHQGATQRLLVWSGNEAAQGRTDLYGSSTIYVEGFVVSQGATAWFNTQAYQGALLADYRQLRADPNYPSYLLMGTEGVRRWVGIFAYCNRALAQSS